MSQPHFLNHLYGTIRSRRTADTKQSYVASLFDKGIKKIAQKVGEEAVETALASAGGNKQEIISESADLIFHLLVLLAAHDITLEEVCTELEQREGISGLTEKSGRKS